MADDATARKRGFLMLFSAIVLPMFLAALDQTLLSTATPRIAMELGGLRDSAWIGVGYMMAVTVMVPVYGRLGDRFGRAQMLRVALAVFALGSLACGLSINMPWLIAARVLQGLGGGGLMVMSQALIGELVGPRRRGTYQGYFAALFTVTSVGGPILGGVVVTHGDWRWLFFANIPLCLLAAWRVSKLVKRTRPVFDDKGPLPDLLSIGLFAASAVGSLVWLTFGGHRFDWWSLASASLLGGCALLWILLIARETRSRAPFLPIDVLAIPGMWPTALTVLCFASTLFALLFMLPIYLQLAHGADASRSGLQLLPLTFGLVVGSTITGRLNTRLGMAGQAPRIGLSAAAASIALYALIPGESPSKLILLATSGLGLGTVMTNAQIISQILAGPRRLGAAAASVALARSTGAATGTAVFGALVFGLMNISLDPTHGNAPLTSLAPRQVDHAFRIAFGGLALFVLMAAWISNRIPRIDLKMDRTKEEPSKERPAREPPPLG